jgi:cob(I)alamin adenosyltransferase
MSRIYTRTGDTGDTGLFGGGRVAKSDRRVAAYGDVDELNAVLGWAILQVEDPELRPRLVAVQRDLFAIGAHLATPAGARSREHLPDLPRARPAEFEAWIDEAEAELGGLAWFILPGGSGAGAALHVARTVCRRAERAVVELAGGADIDADILIYLNRLSDLLFELARLANRRAGVAETPWRSEP